MKTRSDQCLPEAAGGGAVVAPGFPAEADAAGGGLICIPSSVARSLYIQPWTTLPSFSW